jgi:D-alanyl-D-alanine carboxypeptidase/D-alanyl-D-alanine carboxypeptidase (penicillin-binding protein 5/6)
MKRIIAALLSAALVCTFSLSAGAENRQQTDTNLIADLPADLAQSAHNAKITPPNASDISAKAAILIDADSGRVLFEKNKDDKRPVASTTKIMTTLLLLESGDLDTEFTVDPVAIQTEGSSMGLQEGDIVSKRDLAYGMMLPSGNDAANATAYLLGGDLSGFAKMMNDKAAALGLTSTHFITPSGLHSPNHYSTAYDMAMLTREAMENEVFRDIAATESIKIEYGNPPYGRWLSNSNKLLTLYDFCTGIKTGFTDEAGRCLVSSASKDGVNLIAVTLFAPDDWNDHIKMFDYGFAATHNKTLDVDIGKPAVNVAGGTSEKVSLKLKNAPTLLEIDGEEEPQIDCKILVPGYVFAPVKSGETVGKAQFIADGKVFDTVDLIAEKDIPADTKKHFKPFYYDIIDSIKEFI